MEGKSFSYQNAQPVLEKLEQMIANYRHPVKIRDVCDDLSIFDWWTENLNKTQMMQMRTFLKEAIKLGYTGYVCFKVGASMCSNGMWAHKEESTDGYSPKGDLIYRSFSPDYTYWQIKKNNAFYPSSENPCGMKYDSLRTRGQFEKFVLTLQ